MARTGSKCVCRAMNLAAIGIVGTKIATTACPTRKATVMSVALLLARAILMIRATGATFRDTATPGIRASRPAGRLTVMGDGPGPLTTAGPGLDTSPGAGRLITTAGGGITPPTAGVGTPAIGTTVRPGGRLWSDSSAIADAAAGRSASASAALAGLPWRRASAITLGMADGAAAVAIRRSSSTTASISITTTAMPA